MKKIMTVIVCVLLGGVLMCGTACTRVRAEGKSYPEHFEQYEGLLGQPREAVLAKLNLGEENLTACYPDKGYYPSSLPGLVYIPVSALFQGVSFDVALQFDVTTGRLYGFSYLANWEHQWDKAIQDVGSIAGALTETFGQSEERNDPDAEQFGRMSPKRLAEVFEANAPQVGADYWLVKKRSDPLAMEYLEIIRNQNSKLPVPLNLAEDHMNLNLKMSVNAEKSSEIALVRLEFTLKPESVTH